jgi:alcohol dehydrogenase (cytochrome c)
MRPTLVPREMGGARVRPDVSLVYVGSAREQAAAAAAFFAILFFAFLGSYARALDTNSGNWDSYFGNSAAWSYSALSQIDRRSVARLLPAWAFSTAQEGLSATPLVIDGVLFLSTPGNDVFALDAATGHRFWTYRHKVAEGHGGTRAALGLAAGFGLIFLAATDHHLIAIDSKSGREVWNVQISDPKQCGCGPGVAPLLVKDKIVIGVSSSDNAHRGYLDAFDARSGRHVWRFWVIPGPGEPGHDTWPEDLWKLGTSSTWQVGSYDAALNLVYWGVGNPGPMLGSSYAGNKLYSDSLLALDADTGKLKWYFQQIPDDKFDYDSVLEPVLIDGNELGRVRKYVVQPTKSGFAYVIDRETGKFVRGYPFADMINWTKGLDQSGHPLEPRLQLKPGIETLVCPGVFGARAMGHSTYSPRTRLWYNSSYEVCTLETPLSGTPPREGQPFNAGGYEKSRVPANTHPFVGAFDPITGDRKWTYPTNSVNTSSLLSTAGDLIFGGDVFGNVWALDAETGAKLWSFNVGTGISSMPISYAVDGRQYIAVSAGLSFVASVLANEVIAPERQPELPPGGSVLFVFALPQPVAGPNP